jgi:hypothetical protein
MLDNIYSAVEVLEGLEDLEEDNGFKGWICCWLGCFSSTFVP